NVIERTANRLPIANKLHPDFVERDVQDFECVWEEKLVRFPNRFCRAHFQDCKVYEDGSCAIQCLSPLSCNLEGANARLVVAFQKLLEEILRVSDRPLNVSAPGVALVEFFRKFPLQLYPGRSGILTGSPPVVSHLSKRGRLQTLRKPPG